MKTQLTLTGISPLLMHNERLANPLDEHTQTLKQLTSKRTKTADDHRAIGRAEFEGGIYHRPDTGPYIPAWNVKRCFIDGGKLNKLGKHIERYVNSYDFGGIPLQYGGPRTIQELWDAGYCYQTMVGNQQNRVLRTRPKFDEWTLTATFDIDETGIDPKDMHRAATRAGEIVGLGDGRTIGFGRFTVTITT